MKFSNYRLQLLVLLLVTLIFSGESLWAKTQAKPRRFVVSVGFGYGGVVQRTAHRWVYHATLRLGWVAVPKLHVVLENQFFFNLPPSGPNNARFFEVLHAPMLIAAITDDLRFKGGAGLLYLFEQGTTSERKFGIAGIVGLTYRFFHRGRTSIAVEFQVVPAILNGSGHYLFQTGLMFQFN